MKPAALTDTELKYIRHCLDNHFPWTPHKHGLIRSLLAMAVERNEFLKAGGLEFPVNMEVDGVKLQIRKAPVT